jgi:regulatory protein
MNNGGCITAVTRTKRGLWALQVDGCFAFSVHEEVWALSGLAVGSEVSEERLEELRRESDRRLARARALELAGRRSYTGRQLFEKLRREGDDEAAAGAVARMEQLGLINDADYARRCARDLYRLKHYAPAGIVRALRAKGIDTALIEEALAEFDEERNAQRACKYILRRCPAQIGQTKYQNRMQNALLRLGYSYEEIRQAVRMALSGECGEENEDFDPWESI